MLQQKLSHLQIILASSSPRRKALLEELLLQFTTEVYPVDEAFPKQLQQEEITDFLPDCYVKDKYKDIVKELFTNMKGHFYVNY